MRVVFYTVSFYIVACKPGRCPHRSKQVLCPLVCDFPLRSRAGAYLASQETPRTRFIVLAELLHTQAEHLVSLLMQTTERIPRTHARIARARTQRSLADGSHADVSNDCVSH